MTPPPRKRRSRKTRQLQILGGLVFLLLAVWGGMALRPWWLCRTAERILTEDPKRAEALLIESIEKAGGDYPKAQLLLARALGAKGQWIDADDGPKVVWPHRGRLAIRPDPSADAPRAPSGMFPAHRHVRFQRYGVLPGVCINDGANNGIFRSKSRPIPSANSSRSFFLFLSAQDSRWSQDAPESPVSR